MQPVKEQDMSPPVACFMGYNYNSVIIENNFNMTTPFDTLLFEMKCLLSGFEKELP